VITLEQSYEHCRRLNRRNGTTYYWSTAVLPRVKRHHVHALYGFCRHADDIVDDLADVPTELRADALCRFGDRFFDAHADPTIVDRGDPSTQADDLVIKAMVHTVNAFRIEPGCVRRFLSSMEMDLTVESYETYEDLLGYMDGSAAVIGEMMLPILEPTDPAATEPARQLGNAFQLTNFLRDIGEDLDRRRIYVPQEDIRRFDAAPAFAERAVTPGFRDLMAFEIDRTRGLYREADRGIDMLPGRSGRAIRAARQLYSEILDRIEAADLDVFRGRARVPATRKVAIAAKSLLVPA
jgi:15-cis-phytoene synthase